MPKPGSHIELGAVEDNKNGYNSNLLILTISQALISTLEHYLIFIAIL